MSGIAVGAGAANNPVVDELNKVKARADLDVARLKDVIDGLNNKGMVDAAGHKLSFSTAEEWQKALANDPKLKEAGGMPLSKEAIGVLSTSLDHAVVSVAGSQKYLAQWMAEAESSKALQDIINSGDIESALMMLNTNRVKLLDAQLQARMGQMKDRNDKITALNAELEKVQKTWGDGNEKNAEITRINGLLTGLNNDSQLDMIGMQQVVNKRNEAADLMTNLLGKFQKTIDGIVGNFR